MILQGDCLQVLKTLADASVHTVITSPPYWGLRSYNVPPTIYGGIEGCAHEWGDALERGGPAGTQGATSLREGRANVEAQTREARADQGTYCQACGAWRGCLGLEPTPELFVEHLVTVFREVRRVLRDEGTLWLNIGDCYATGAGRLGQHPGGGAQGARWMGDVDRIRDNRRGYRGEALANGHGDVTDRTMPIGPVTQPNRMPIAGLKDKDLVGVPWRLAFALQADGWWLRAENIWAKGLSFCESWAGSVMPESVRDRPTRSHEQVFLFTKRARYYYDQWAVREKGVYPAGTIAAKGSGTREGNRRQPPRKKDIREEEGERRQTGSFQDRVDAGYACYDGTRNLRTVWAISPTPFSEAHFATFPEALVIPMIAAGTSAHGVCSLCGAPWVRQIEQEPIPADVQAQFDAARTRTAEDHGRDDGFTTRRPNFERRVTGETWAPSCTGCGDLETVDGEPVWRQAPVVPATVLDPFAGSGTVGLVAAQMGRRFVGIELNPEYVAMAERRIADAGTLLSALVEALPDESQPSLFVEVVAEAE